MSKAASGFAAIAPRMCCSPRNFFRTLLGVLVAGAVTVAGRAQTSAAISLSGFTHDIVVTSGAVTNSYIPTLNVEFYEQGADLSGLGFGSPSQGLPVGGSFLSEANNAIGFQLAPYGSANSLVLLDTESTNMTLVSAGSFQDLHFLATAQGGLGASMAITLHFTDSSTTAVPTFSAISDWTDTSDGYAVAARDMGVVGTGVGGVYSDALFLKEFDYVLSGADQAKTLDYFTVAYTTSNGPLMFFGASGTAIPEPALMRRSPGWPRWAWSRCVAGAERISRAAPRH